MAELLRQVDIARLLGHIEAAGAGRNLPASAEAREDEIWSARNVSTNSRVSAVIAVGIPRSPRNAESSRTADV